MRNYDQMSSGLEKINTMLSTIEKGMRNGTIPEKSVFNLVTDALKTLELVQTLFRREKP